MKERGKKNKKLDEEAREAVLRNDLCRAQSEARVGEKVDAKEERGKRRLAGFTRVAVPNSGGWTGSGVRLRVVAGGMRCTRFDDAGGGGL